MTDHEKILLVMNAELSSMLYGLDDYIEIPGVKHLKDLDLTKVSSYEGLTVRGDNTEMASFVLHMVQQMKQTLSIKESLDLRAQALSSLNNDVTSPYTQDDYGKIKSPQDKLDYE